MQDKSFAAVRDRGGDRAGGCELRQGFAAQVVDAISAGIESLSLHWCISSNAALPCSGKRSLQAVGGEVSDTCALICVHTASVRLPQGPNLIGVAQQIDSPNQKSLKTPPTMKH